MLRDGRGQIHRIAIYEATWMRSHGGALASGPEATSWSQRKWDVSIPPSFIEIWNVDQFVGKRYMLITNFGYSPKGKFSDRPEVVVRHFCGLVFSYIFFGLRDT